VLPRRFLVSRASPASQSGKPRRRSARSGRPYFMHHRELLGPLCTAAWQTVRELMAVAAGEEQDFQPGMVAMSQTFGDQLNPPPARTRARHPRRLDRRRHVGTRVLRQLLRCRAALPAQGDPPPSARGSPQRGPHASTPLLAPFRVQRAQLRDRPCRGAMGIAGGCDA